MTTPFRKTSRSSLLCCLIATLVVFTLASSVAAFAAVNGALQTTDITGTVVNGNIYTSKSAVYITGGPQNTKDPGLVPDGNYYFQVTDPSGSVLLSLDDISCREVVVSGGRITGVPTTPPPAACVDGYHNPGTLNASNGELPIQLCNPDASKCPKDFADTPNPGGEYKTWITPVANYSPSGQDNCTQQNSHVSFGFCDSDSKTDNFKIRAPGTASITACKFNDQNGNGIQDDLVFGDDTTFDPLIAGWPITATGVDGGTVTQNTGQDGCTSFTYTFPKGGSTTDTVTLTEGTLGAPWTQTAPPNGTCTLTGTTVNTVDTCNVAGATPPTGSPASGGVITLTASPNDIVIAPFFGNTQGAALVGLVVSKTASGGNNFTWNTTKNVDKTEIDDTNGTATFNYTVTVTHDAGAGWQVQGSISVYNPNTTGGSDGNGAIDGVTITDNIDNSGTCNVNGTGTNTYGPVIINGGDTLPVPYTCTFTKNPVSGNNTFSVSWDPSYAGGGPVSNNVPYDFTSADTSTTVTDSIAGNLGSVAIQSDNSTQCTAATIGFTGSNLLCSVSGSTATFTYSETFTGDPAGTCTNHNNTASFLTNTGGTGSSNQVTVEQCVGEDVTVKKTASAAFTAGLSKSVDKTKVEQSGGNITFNYTVSLTSPSFTVTGTITVTNPNDWESVTVTVADTIDSGGACTVTGGTGVVIAPLGSSGPLSYTCTYTTNPTLVSGTNTATAAETATKNTTTGKPGIVPGTPAPGTATYTFNTLTIKDSVQSSTYPGGCTATLGTVSVTTTTPSTTPGCGVTNLKSPSWGVFTYSIVDANAPPGTCNSYNNTATITGGASSNPPTTVTVCNTNTGGLTMGFWKNTNGQKIITTYCSPTGGTSLMTYLSGFNPFKDDTATTCKNEATYVYNIINGATCSSGGYCNTMLRAQMLATALDVYFSTPINQFGGGNQIGGYNGLGSKTPALGGIAIDLSHICNMTDGSSGSTCSGKYEDARYEFGIVTTGGCLGTTVTQMLLYSDYASAVNGSPVATASNGATWYQQNKTKQVYAKDGFDNTNNQIANIVPSGPGVCSSPSF